MELQKKKPRKDQGQNLLRWSRDELELISAAAEKADQPIPVWLRRTVIRAAAAALGVPASRLRGNPGDYVNGRHPVAMTCAKHEGEPIYLTDAGPTCARCALERVLPETGT